MSDAFMSSSDPASAHHNVATTSTPPLAGKRREAKGSLLHQDPAMLQANGSPHHGMKSATGDGHSHFDSIRRRLKRTRESGGFLLEKGASRKSSAETRGERENIERNLDEQSQSKRKTRERGEKDVDRAELPVDTTSVEKAPEDTESLRDQLPITQIERSPPNGKRMLHDPQTAAPRSSSSTLPSMDASLSHSSKREAQEWRSTAPTLDSAQIVRMALNLSESRRMNLEPGQLAAVPAPSTSRATSGMLPPTDAALHGSPHHQSRERPDSSRDGHFPSQSPSSRRSQALSHSPRSSVRGSSAGVSDVQPEYLYHISPATLSRAEKAKRYFELAHQHRRLLEYLPPLRPEGSSHVDEPNNLGRPYNPLQFLRDRNIRGSHSVLQDPAWNDVGRIQNWMNLVEEESNSWGYQVDDVALLPPFGGLSHDAATTEQREGDRTRSGTVSSAKKGQRVPFSWSINPAGLLEDAYWLEQDDHKAKIENRDGSKPFRQVRRPPRSAGTGDGKRRSETISHKRHRSNEVDYNSSPTITKTATAATSEGSEDDNSAVEARPVTHTDTKKSRVKRRLLKRNRTRSDSSDDLGASESDSLGKNHVHGHQYGRDVNIGPLERHMRYLLEQESAQQNEYLETKSSEGQRRLGISEQSHGPKSQKNDRKPQSS